MRWAASFFDNPLRLNRGLQDYLKVLHFEYQIRGYILYSITWKVWFQKLYHFCFCCSMNSGIPGSNCCGIYFRSIQICCILFPCLIHIPRVAYQRASFRRNTEYSNKYKQGTLHLSIMKQCFWIVKLPNKQIKTKNADTQRYETGSERIAPLHRGV